MCKNWNSVAVGSCEQKGHFTDMKWGDRQRLQKRPKMHLQYQSKQTLDLTELCDWVNDPSLLLWFKSCISMNF